MSRYPDSVLGEVILTTSASTSDAMLVCTTSRSVGEVVSTKLPLLGCRTLRLAPSGVVNRRGHYFVTGSYHRATTNSYAVPRAVHPLGLRLGEVKEAVATTS